MNLLKVNRRRVAGTFMDLEESRYSEVLLILAVEKRLHPDFFHSVITNTIPPFSLWEN